MTDCEDPPRSLVFGGERRSALGIKWVGPDGAPRPTGQARSFDRRQVRKKGTGVNAKGIESEWEESWRAGKWPVLAAGEGNACKSYGRSGKGGGWKPLESIWVEQDLIAGESVPVLISRVFGT